RPRVERAGAPRDVHRTVRDGDAVAAHDLYVVAAAGVRQARVLRDQVAVADGEVRAQEPQRLEQLDGRHPVLDENLVELDDAVRGVSDDGHPQLVGGLAGGAEEIEAARLHLAGRQEPAYAAPG